MPSSTRALSSAGGSSGSPGQLSHAYLEVHEAEAGDGGLRPGSVREQIHFQFNPTRLTLAKSADWGSRGAVGAGSAAPPEFRGAEPGRLSLEMFLDATDTLNSSVVDTVEHLFECCVPTSASQNQQRPVPPLVVFHWGLVASFPCYIRSVSATYTLFTPQGTPVRALVSIQLNEMPSQTQRQNPTSGGLEVRRAHTLVAGETLASVSQREYGTPARWRDIADANGIDDPTRVAPGRGVLLPGSETAAAGRRP